MSIDRKSVRRLVLGGFILFLLIFWFTYTGRTLLDACRPMFTGLVIAYPMNIMISFFRRHDPLYNRKIMKSEKAHNVLTTVLAVILLLAILAFITGYVVPQLTGAVIALVDRVPTGVQELLEMPFVAKLLPRETEETLRNINWKDWINSLVNLVNSDDLFRSMTETASYTVSAISSFFFGILFACYFLSGKNTALSVSKRLVRAFVPEKHQEQVFHSGTLLNDCFHIFLVCQALQALIMGVAATVLMNLFRFPYASMIGVLSGLSALIPVIGGYIGAAFGTLMILTESPMMAALFLIFIIVLQNVIGLLIFPKLVGNSLGLPAVWTLAAVMVGSGLAGIMGILIGVPITAFFYRLIKEKLIKKEDEVSKGAAPGVVS